MLNKVSCPGRSVKIALIAYWNDFSLIPFGNCASLILKGGLRKNAKKMNK